MIGKKIHHYEITEKLGEGGMGIVYKARDTKLNRTVALKFLHPTVVDSAEEQERLIAEARAAAGLTHPNICTIHEINEHNGQTFIVMSYVGGATLRHKVLSGTVALTDALRYGIQIADGLKQAHDKGIIHRDIKSANIMINDAGQAVIMDFGLAKRATEPTGEERFSSGGTSAYKSPEQARGEGVDQLTDIWSLGVVLYEMIAGQLPFRGDYEQAVIYSVLNESPRPIAELRDKVPVAIIQIIDRCLEKSPSDRYQSLADLIVALRSALDDMTNTCRPSSSPRPRSRSRLLTIAGAAVLTIAAAIIFYDFLGGREAESEIQIPIAVIDFTNETGETSLDGLSGMLITALEQYRHLSVMTRTRMFDLLKVLGRDGVPRITESIGQEICREANVGVLVIPTIRKFGTLYTIDLKVLDTRSNRYIFTTKRDGQGQESIPDMIDKIAHSIRIDLKDIPQVEEPELQIAEMTTVDLNAYQAYFKGDELVNNLDFKQAAEQFQKAIELDSTFALAHYRLAYSEWWWGERDKASKHLKYALSHIDRVPEKERFLVRALDAGLKEGFEAQVVIFKEMQERYPNDKEMLFGIGDAAFHSAQIDTAEVYFKKVLALDPEFDRALQHLTWLYVRNDRVAEGVEVAEKWLKVTHSAEARENLADAYAALGETEKARQLLVEGRKMDPDSYGMARKLSELLIAEGDTREAESILRSVIASHSKGKIPADAYKDLVNGVLTYGGKLKEARQTLDSGLSRALSSSEIDSSQIVRLMNGKAFLRIWGYDDRAGARELIEEAQHYVSGHKHDGMVDNLLLRIMAGDTATARTMYGEIAKTDPGQKTYVQFFMDSFDGNCDKASVVVDTMVAKYGGMREDQVNGMRFLLGMCYSEKGDYARTIEQLEPFVDSGRVNFDNAAALPMAISLMAEACDKIGDAERATAYYKRLLDIWKDADADNPRYQKANKRYKELLAASSM